MWLGHNVAGPQCGDRMRMQHLWQVAAALTSTLSPPRIGSGHCTQGRMWVADQDVLPLAHWHPKAECSFHEGPAPPARPPRAHRPHAPQTRGAGCSQTCCRRPGRWRSRRRTTRGTRRGSCCARVTRRGGEGRGGEQRGDGGERQVEQAVQMERLWLWSARRTAAATQLGRPLRQLRQFSGRMALVMQLQQRTW